MPWRDPEQSCVRSITGEIADPLVSVGSATYQPAPWARRVTCPRLSSSVPSSAKGSQSTAAPSDPWAPSGWEHTGRSEDCSVCSWPLEKHLMPSQHHHRSPTLGQQVWTGSGGQLSSQPRHLKSPVTPPPTHCTLPLCTNAMDRAPQPQLTPHKNLGSAIPDFRSQRPMQAGGQAEEEFQRGEGTCLPTNIFRHHHLCDQDANWRLLISFVGSQCPVKWWIHLS